MNLENLNLVELDAQEIQEVEGGIIPPYWVWVASGLAWDILSSPQEAYNSFSNGFNQWK